MKKISLLLSIILLVVLVGCWSSVSTPKIEGVYQNEKILIPLHSDFGITISKS